MTGPTIRGLSDTIIHLSLRCELGLRDGGTRTRPGLSQHTDEILCSIQRVRERKVGYGKKLSPSHTPAPSPQSPRPSYHVLPSSFYPIEGQRRVEALHVEVGLARRDAVLRQRGTEVLHHERGLRFILPHPHFSRRAHDEKESEHTPLLPRARPGARASGCPRRSSVFARAGRRRPRCRTRTSALREIGGVCCASVRAS